MPWLRISRERHVLVRGEPASVQIDLRASVQTPLSPRRGVPTPLNLCCRHSSLIRRSAAIRIPGNVAVVRTDAHWDAEAQEVYDRGWKENREEWNRLGSDKPYHYLGSPRTMLGVGEAFGEAVLELEALA